MVSNIPIFTPIYLGFHDPSWLIFFGFFPPTRDYFLFLQMYKHPKRQLLVARKLPLRWHQLLGDSVMCHSRHELGVRAAEERLNLPCSGLLALLSLCTDCSEDLQAIRRRGCQGWKAEIWWEFEICFVWRNMRCESRILQKSAPGPNVKMLIDLSLGEIYGPSVMGEAGSASHWHPCDPWYRLVALKLWVK